MARLILIRHGETNYNLEKKYCGFSDPPLNDKGRWQSEKLSRRLKNIRIDKIYSSDLRRAYETAEIAFKTSSFEKLPDFREMDFGVLEGLRYEEIIKKYPGLYKSWINNPLNIKIPKGESLKDLCKRVKEGLNSILSKHKGKTLALVTHGGPIKIILSDIMRDNLKSLWETNQKCGALNIINC